MINIIIYDRFSGNKVADLEITDRVTLVAGNSGTGKTHICDMLDDRPDNNYRYEVFDDENNQVNAIYCSSIDYLKTVMLDKKKEFSVVILDEYLVDELNKIENKEVRGMLDKACMYFVMFQRDEKVKYHLGVNSVYKVMYDNGYKFVKILKFGEIDKLEDLPDFHIMICEDGKSGYKILHKYFDIDGIMNVIKADGNSKVPACLEDNKDDICLCSLDYDKGSWVLYKIKELIKGGILKAENIKFISMEAFEEIICNSKLLQDKHPELKELTDHVEKYIDCSFQHRGEYFLTLIKRFFVDKPGDIHYKYTKKNVRCFITECKECKNINCTFRQDDVEKISIIFNNKYQILYELYKKLKEEN